MTGKYDITIKELFSKKPSRFLELLTGFREGNFIDTQLPEIFIQQSDMILELPDKSIFQLEIQSTNDKKMYIRMYGYSYLILSKFDVLAKQMVLYVGDKPLNMRKSIRNQLIKYEYILKDIRDFDSNELLNSKSIEDNIIALLCKTDDQIKLIREILKRIKKIKSKNQINNYIKKLIEISHLRKLDVILLEEVKKMSITIDIKEHALYKEGIKEGKLEGIKEGKLEGIKEGKLEGIKEGKLKSVIKLHKKLGLSFKEIADCLDLEEDEVRSILSNIS